MAHIQDLYISNIMTRGLKKAKVNILKIDYFIVVFEVEGGKASIESIFIRKNEEEFFNFLSKTSGQNEIVSKVSFWLLNIWLILK